MATNNDIQTKLFKDIQNRRLFDQAYQFGLEHLAEAFDRPVFPNDKALENLSHFEESLPEFTGNAESILQLLHQYGAPATVGQIGGRYHGFVNGSIVPTGLAAKILGSFWDQNSGMHIISPIAGKLEEVTESWLKEIFGLPDSTRAGFVTGTSAANFCGLAAARFRLLQKQGWDVNQQGLFNAPPMRIVTSQEAHSTIKKAIGMIGFGNANVEWVPTDEQGRLDSNHLPELDANTLVILQAGNVNSGSYDPIKEVCLKAKSAGAWVHIDGAFGLWARAVNQLKYLTEGMELATSWAVDGHKTLNTPYDCGIILCADEEAIVSAMHMSGGYLILGDHRNGMFYTPDMSRRARVIDLWATMKYLGRQGIDEMIFNMHERAKQFAQLLDATAGFEVLNDVVFNQVVVKCASDSLTEKTITQIQALRTCWVGGSTWKGFKVIRISVCAWSTTPNDVEKSVASFKKALQLVQEERQ